MRREGDLRLVLFLGLSGLGLLLLVARAAQFAIWEHDRLGEVARGQHTDQIDLPAKRGLILDRQGRTLACTLENPSLAVRLRDAAERRRVLEATLRAGACTRDRAEEIVATGDSGFVWVNRRWVSEDVLRRIPTDLGGLERHQEFKRFYPAGVVAPQTLGIVGTEGRGLSGIEWQCQDWLAGEPGRLLQFVTGGGRPQNAPPARVLRDPQPGGGLLLTLDCQIQEIVRHRLLEGIARSEASEGLAIVCDPWTGGVLALVQLPEFDPLDPASLATEGLRMAAMMDQYEPGSVFKIVPLCAAFEAGLVTPADTFYCYQGARRVHGCTIRDLKRFGFLTVADILTFSSNIGAGRVAECCGWQRVCQMAQDLGFGTPSGVEVAGEAAGYLPQPLRRGWSDRSLVTLAYGQEVACTALQLAFAFAAIANGGQLVKPRLVEAFLDAEGRVVRRCPPEIVRRAISPETAATMTALLRRAVAEGTGKAAEVAHYPPAGKTGTAQLIDPETGRYSEEEHILSFVGFAPYDDPRFVCLVVLRTRAQLHAGDAAAPVFGEIVKDLVWILEREHWKREALCGTDETPVRVPDVRGLPPEPARQALHRARLVPVLEEAGARIARSCPAPHALVPEGSVIRLSLGGDRADGSVQVPDLRGLSLRSAASLLAAAGLTVAVSGAGWVVQQEPAAGNAVAAGTRCRLQASRAASRARSDAVQRRDLVCRAQ